MKENNKLQVILAEQGIEKSDVGKLVEAFGGPFEEAGVILETYQNIKVTDVNDTAGMQKAREARLLLKKARTTVENSRKELKADIVKQGKAIDSVARFVKEEIEPAEQYLQLQEDFAVIAKAEAEAKLKAERVEKLMQYTDDVSLYNFETMTVEQFDNLLATLKSSHEAKLAEAKRIEDERIAKEKKDAEDREAQRQENEKLKAEADARAEADRKAEQARIDENNRISKIKVALLEYSHGLHTIEEADKAKVALANHFDGLPEADQANEIVIAAHSKSGADIQELKQYLIDEADIEARKAKEIAEGIEKAKADEAEKQALLAPDKEKLMQFAQAVDLIRANKLPAVKSKQAQDVLNDVELKLSQLFNFIMDEAKKL